MFCSAAVTKRMKEDGMPIAKKKKKSARRSSSKLRCFFISSDNKDQASGVGNNGERGVGSANDWIQAKRRRGSRTGTVP